MVNFLLNDKVQDWSKLKEFADVNINVTEKLKFVVEKIENCVGEGEKCWLPALSPFPSLLSKGLFLRAVKSCDHVLKGCKVFNLDWSKL